MGVHNMKEYQVTLTVKNNYLFRHMQLKGIGSVKELAKKTKLSTATVQCFLALRNSPMTINGWKQSVLRLAEYFNCKPEELFPEQHHYEPLAKNKASFEMSSQDVMEITSSLRQAAISPEDLLMLTQSKSYVNETIQQILGVRDYEIMQRQFGLESGAPEVSKTIAASLKISPARVNQIGKDALKKIKKHANIDRRFAQSVKTIIGDK